MRGAEPAALDKPGAKLSARPMEADLQVVGRDAQAFCRCLDGLLAEVHGSNQFCVFGFERGQ